jgi:hypothetical protein
MDRARSMASRKSAALEASYLIIINEAALHRHLKLFLEYYHGTRTHLSLEKDTPESRSVQPPESGRVVAVPQAGGLHDRYERRAA